MSKYAVLQQPVETLLTWIKSGEIAIPEIQRPFVWKAAKVRDLIDSLYRGYPVGYIITWRNPDVKLKNGEKSAGKKVLIDGQQRITALTAAVVGRRVLDSNYKEITITISFNPISEKFEVLNNVIEKDPQWIPSIHPIINDEVSISKAIRNYISANPDADEDQVEERIENLKRIKNQQIGIIELAETLDIDMVTDIFIRINQKGVVLSNADFVMSKIAADEAHDGNKMRKMVDYFCRLIVDKDFHKHIQDNDKAFAALDYYQTIKWMAKGRDDLYIPDYIDMLRVAFTYQFNRGKFSDLVALLSGRNFEQRTFEDAIIERSFLLLGAGLMGFANQAHYQRFLMLVESTGLINRGMVSSKTSLNVSYALYLKLCDQGMPDAQVQRYVHKWLILALLLGRYSGSSESVIDEDIKEIHHKGIAAYLDQMEQARLGKDFWEVGLVNDLETSSTGNNAFKVYLASLVYGKAEAFLSKSMQVSTLLTQRGDMHHIFPKAYLQKHKYAPKQYNQVANLVYTEQTTNIKIGEKSPKDYLADLRAQIASGKPKISTLDSEALLTANMAVHDIPELLFSADHSAYGDFLLARRKLMAARIQRYYQSL